MAEAQLSLSSFKNQLDDQLTCSVCLDQYTNPKTLPCHHSFCLECVQPLLVEIKDGKYYISCPTCRTNHLIPQGGVINLPNDFKINSLLDLRKKMSISKSLQQTPTSSTTCICPKHNDPLKVYCETCCQIICRDCTISEEHNIHNFYLISECYPKHHQQILDSLDIVKHKLADVNTAVTDLDTKAKEVLQQGQQLKKQINTHAQKIIDQVQKSCTHLSQQVDTIVQQKTQILIAQRQQAQKLHTQLETCLDMIERCLKEWTEQQILTEKCTMMEEMNTATHHVDQAVFQPIENSDMQFTKIDTSKNEIGFITSTTYGKAILKASPCVANQSSTATLTLQSLDGLPFPLPPSLISSTLVSTCDKHSVNCDITQTNPGKYSIIFTPSTRQDQLRVQVGGIDIPDSPFILPIILSPEMRDKPVRIITGLNQPKGIAVCDNRDIVVAERSTHCITILNKVGEKMKSFGTKQGQFLHPCGVTTAIDGHILVTDDHRLQKLTTDGVCVKSVGSSNSGSGKLQFYYPKHITVHPTTGQIFVADSGNNRIQVFTNDLTFSQTITVHGNKQLIRQYIYDIALDNEGYLYVAKMGDNCIVKLTTTGHYVTMFGSKGSAPGQLSRPISLTVNNNLIYVSEWGNHRVSVFDTTGKFLHCFGKKGSGEGEFNGPSGIAMDTSDNLYVSDTDNNRLVVY